MSFFLAPSLVRFRDEINQRWPNRSIASDGWIGDPSHAARVSSHNPRWDLSGRWRGVVRAIDVTNVDNDPHTDLRAEVVKAAVGHPAVWYVISRGVIWSRTFGWRARRYTGSNRHDKHVHISLRESAAAWDSRVPWFEPQFKVRAVPVNYTSLKHHFLIGAGAKEGKRVASNNVARVQQALNAEYNAGLEVDGRVGEKTLNAWGRHEEKVGGSGRPRVPDLRSLDALARGRFRTVGRRG